MENFKGKKLILAVTGSIAAYKTPELVRQFIKKGAEVRVLMTNSASDFVSPLALATVSKHPVLNQVSHGDQWNNHVELGLWADAMIVAPCSANTLAKLAHGLCDNIVTAVYLSARCPVMIAPAMDEDMWKHPSTQKNIDCLVSYGNLIIPVEHGELASGLVGPGRMAETENIVAFVHDFFSKKNNAANTNKEKRALVSAGPTYEYIDPVRFIGNFSSGKMGIAIAEALADAGFAVDLVLGPSPLTVQNSLINITRVTTAQEMYDACISIFPNTSIAVMSAAVADFRPETKAISKIKKGDDDTLDIKLVKNPDILASLGKIKQAHQTLVGFALETNNELENAQGKLIKKQADYIVLNSLNDAGAGFGGDQNKVTLIGKNNFMKSMPLQSKKVIAQQLIKTILEQSS